MIYGCARQAGGVPTSRAKCSSARGSKERPAFTVNQACGSGLQAILLAADHIRLGKARVVLAGGTENMTRVPYYLDRARLGYRMGNATVVDGMYRDGFLDPICGLVMGETAERLADLYSIPREEQDAYALESQRRAAEAIQGKRFDREIVPVTVPGRKGDVVVAADEHPRAGTTTADLAKLPPVFRERGRSRRGTPRASPTGPRPGRRRGIGRTRKGPHAPGVARAERDGGCGSLHHGDRTVPAVHELLAASGRELPSYG